ncbi:hypothetical protein BGZ61DRAFT_464890 [Ilyonectria robusta]|uniref:uncharacterized protein n=1 Tax=Ilyonectria robusta TaxID=1079257 RepID=UPI001E8E5495|nr:uncharacterized protein BGZ61DRAFT_464890 [Ilyonectria robusta]KAH8659690.1 hypothetical protein BGZ61DRAFT_464890 [Ilyonectria robusta]
MTFFLCTFLCYSLTFLLLQPNDEHDKDFSLFFYLGLHGVGGSSKLIPLYLVGLTRWNNSFIYTYSFFTVIPFGMFMITSV